MFGIGKYPGDEKTKTLLAQYYPGVSFDEVRAATAGAILAVENVQPSQLFEHLFMNESNRLSPNNMAAAREWTSCLMGLWNELADHQETDNPFLFSEWPLKYLDENENCLPAAAAREREIEQFLWGLRAGGTPFAEHFVNPTPKSLKSWIPSILEFTLKIIKRKREELESGASTNRLGLSAIHFALNDLIKKHHSTFVTATLDLRKQWVAEMKHTTATTFVRNDPKVGRNDPCLCGSGKKFKHCCLH